MTSDLELIPTVPTLKLGRKHTLHRANVLIEDNRVVLRTRCGLDPIIDGFVETFGIPTCDTCDQAWEAR